MKKIFTLLAFLVVTANAAAQYKNKYLNVGDQSKVSECGFLSNQGNKGEKGVVENNRLNVAGCVLSFFDGNWGWIDGSATYIPQSTANKIDGWEETGVFKGPDYFFASQNSKYSAYNNSESQDRTIVFYISNCSAIDVFLYHVAASKPGYDYSGTFYIKAYPLNNDVFPTNPSLEANVTISDTDGSKSYFPSLYGLDKSKIYKIQLTIPRSTFFHEISFLSRDLRTYTTKVTDGVNWGTMYLDFPVTIPTNHPSLEVYTVEAATDNCCFLSDPIIGTIPANTGVLLYEPVPDHNEIEFVETSELNLNTVSKGVLRGTVTEGFTVGQALDGQPENSKVLTLGKISDNVGFFIYRKNKSTETLAKYKAYLIHKYSTSTSNENVKGIYISDFDELTGIQSVEIENTESGNWYSLQGVQLNSRPTQRGIYLNNGKKVLVK